MKTKLFGAATIAALALGMQPAAAQSPIKIGFISTFSDFADLVHGRRIAAELFGSGFCDAEQRAPRVDDVQLHRRRCPLQLAA